MRNTYPSSAFTAFVNLLPPYLGSAASPPSPLPPLYCSMEIVLLSPCLPYITLPPNNLLLSVPPRCCDAFSPSAISLSCLCDLFHQPFMLGFPLNLTKLSRLPANCKVRNVDLHTKDLKSLCSDSLPLPPLLSSQGSTLENLANAGPSEAPSQLPDIPRDPTINSSLSPGFQFPKEVVAPATTESATSLWAVNQLNLLIWCTIFFLVCRRML